MHALKYQRYVPHLHSVYVNWHKYLIGVVGVIYTQ